MEKFFTPISKVRFYVMASMISLMFFQGPHAALSQSVKLYTPYTKISVPPGETISYTVEVINDSRSIKNATISIKGMPKDWTYTLKSGGYTIDQISVLPDEKKSLTLAVNVPFKVEKGNYTFGVSAAGLGYLPLTVNVSEQGTYKTEFTSKQPNMEGHASSTFTFNADIKNSTAEEQLYALRAQAPRGWLVTFKANYKQATSVNVAPNATESITIDVNPPDYIKADTYTIPVQAVTSNTSAKLDLEVVISGSYEMELTSPTGLMSTKTTAGSEKRIDISVRNTGSTTLRDVTVTSGKPKEWEVVFDPKEIESIDPGQGATVTATIKAADKAIPGDYILNMEAKTPEVSAKAAYRVTVKTPVLTGWLGILIILGVIGTVVYLFRKYGRR